MERGASWHAWSVGLAQTACTVRRRTSQRGQKKYSESDINRREMKPLSKSRQKGRIDFRL